MYAEMEPPPGAGDSDAVSSANSLHVMSTSFFSPALSEAIRYSMIFSFASNGFSSSSPIDLTAIRTISLSGMPDERCCL